MVSVYSRGTATSIASTDGSRHAAGCFCAQQRAARPASYQSPWRQVVAVNTGADQACTWPRCLVPALKARLGNSPSTSGGTSGGARSVVPGAVAAGIQAFSTSSSARLEVGPSSQWQSIQQQQPVLLAVVDASVLAGQVTAQTAASRSGSVALPSSAWEAPQQQRTQERRGKRRSRKQDVLLDEIQAAESFVELRAIWQRESRSTGRGSGGGSSSAPLKGHHLATFLRSLAECILKGQLQAPSKVQQQSADDSPDTAADIFGADIADGDDWEGSWQSPARAFDSASASWDGADTLARSSRSPRSSFERPPGTTVMGAQASTSGRAAESGWAPIRQPRQPLSPRAGGNSSFDSSSNTTSSSTGNGVDGQRRRLWPSGEGRMEDEQQQEQGFSSQTEQPEQRRQQQLQSQQQPQDQSLKEHLDHDREQAREKQQVQGEPIAVQAREVPSTVLEQLQPQPSQQQEQQQQQQQQQQLSPRLPAGLRRPPPRSPQAVAEASRSRDDSSPPGSPRASGSLDSFDTSKIGSVSAGLGSSRSSIGDDVPSSLRASPAGGASPSASLSVDEQEQQQQQAEADGGGPGGQLLSSATMEQRMRRLAGGRMIRAYGSRAVAGVGRAGGRSWEDPRGGGPRAATAAEAAVTLSQVEELLSQVLSAVRSEAACMAPVLAAAALRSLAELRLNDRATVRALLSAPLSPRRLLGQPGGSGGGGAGRAARLGAVVTSLAVLGHAPPRGWLAAAAVALGAQRSDLLAAPGRAPGQAARLAFHLARSGWRPGADEAAELAGALQARLGQLEPTELVQAVQTLALVGHVPDDVWLLDFFAAARKALGSTPPLRIVHILSALADMGRRPDDPWLRSMFAALGPAELRALPPEAWPPLLHSLGALAARPDGPWLRSAYAICAVHALRKLPPRGLGELAAAAAALGMQPPAAWVAELEAAAFWQLTFAGPAELAALGAGLCALRASPGTVWLQQYESRSLALLSDCDGLQLAQVLRALAGLRHRPSAAWLAAFEEASHDKLGAFGPEGLSSTARALADLMASPSLSWVYAFVLAAYSRLEAFDAAQLGALFEALPKLAPHPRWVDDLVQICSYEAVRKRQAAAEAAQQGAAAEQQRRRKQR